MTQQLTPNFALPYYQGSDPADGATQQQALAAKLDTVLGQRAAVPVTVSSLVGEVGQATQARAGRQLALADFTSLGLSAPRGLWNLSDLTDASGNGRTLQNKNAVTFAAGINGAAATAAQFRGASGTPATDPALYIDAAGGSANFNMTNGSWGCWFRTAKRTNQGLLAKRSAAVGQFSYDLYIATNVLSAWVSTDGSNYTPVATGLSDVADDRWHFGVATFDGTVLRVYVDGVLETTVAQSGAIFTSGGPLNIGAEGADNVTAGTAPHFGRVDEAFVTADVLSDDQVRLLYAARLVHTLGATPKTVSLNVRRQRKGAALVTGDFSPAMRLHNFTAGSLADQGSNATPLTVASGTPLIVAGADGTLASGYSFNGAASLGATDAQMPSGLNPRSYGCWLKCSQTGAGAYSVIGWGTVGTADTRVFITNGVISCNNGSDIIGTSIVADGQWHFLVVVEDNSLAPGVGDGVKRKVYIDGRMANGSTVMNGITLAGANRFRIGAAQDGSSPFIGQIDSAFVAGYALTGDDVLRLYAKGAQMLAASPKNAGDHVESFDSGSLLVVADTLEAQHYIDLILA